MRKKTVIIHWSYPIKLENIFSKEVISHIGIYCIYRRFGNNTTLLYIGKTSYSFKSRLFSHEQTWLKYLRGQIFVRFGEIISPTAIDDTLIEDIESALIYCKDPIYNDKKKCSYTYRTNYYVFIKNKGFRGSLPYEIDAKKQAYISIDN